MQLTNSVRLWTRRFVVLRASPGRGTPQGLSRGRGPVPHREATLTFSDAAALGEEINDGIIGGTHKKEGSARLPSQENK
jgi:hypothetical protein